MPLHYEITFADGFSVQTSTNTEDIDDAIEDMKSLSKTSFLYADTMTFYPSHSVLKVRVIESDQHTSNRLFQSNELTEIRSIRDVVTMHGADESGYPLDPDHPWNRGRSEDS